MGRRSAPKICFFLLWIALANGVPAHTGGQENQLHYKSESAEVTEYRDSERVERSLNKRDKENLKSDEASVGLLNLFSRELPEKTRSKRDVQNIDIEHDNVAERNAIPGDLYPETAIHNLEQTSDKIKSDMLERKSKIPTRDTRVNDKAVYNIGQDVSLEIPLTAKVDERGARIEELTKRDTISQEEKGPSQDNRGSVVRNGAKEETLGAVKGNSTRRDEVPVSMDDASDEDFQVRDKSADLEIHADSSGVRVKAKPASLQVVSNPHGDVQTLPGETHSEGLIAERRTFTPVIPGEKRTPRLHHHLFHHLGPRPFHRIPFLRHHHRFHRLHHHRLPWLRHRQHINYPDIFERMRSQNAMSEGLSSLGMSPAMGLPLSIAPPMASMINSPPPMTSMMNSPPMMSPGGPDMSMMGGGGMGSPLIPQFIQRSPMMEDSPTNRFGVPENPMGMSPMGGMSPGEMSSMGSISPGEMSPMEEMRRMNPMADMFPMGRMGQMDQMGPIMNSMSGMYPMSPSSPFGQSEMRRKNALEFWGMPNQDQLRALARGENVQKVLGSNRYGESLGGITGGWMNFPGGMSPGMGGPSFNANGLGESGMMGRFGGTSSAMFRGGMSNMMDNGIRRNMLYKKDDINKTDEYKKSMKLKKSRDGKSAPTDSEAVSDKTKDAYEGEKFEEGILKKAKSLVAGEKHIAKNEETILHREHRIRKSSKLAHDEEKRSLPQDAHSKKNAVKPSHQKIKNVKGSKKDVAVQRPPIVYHPPPEVYHRPDIVLHRAPVLFQRPPIVYHQAPVVVHRPAVVYRQPPIVFHQPHPVISQPYYTAWDNFMMNPAYSHIGSQVAQGYNYMGLPQEVTGYRKGVVPSPPSVAGKKDKDKMKKKTKRTDIPDKKKKSYVDKSDKVAQKKKKDVVVNRPPIIYHPPPEVYHRPEIVVHRAPLLIRRPPIVYHQPAVIVHRPPVVYHQPPIIFHQPAPTVNQPVLYSHDNFVVHPSFFATHHGSIVSDAGQLLGIPNTVSVPDTGAFPYEPVGVNPGLGPGGFPSGGTPPFAPLGRRRRSLKHKKKSKHVNAKRKNAILVKRPPIVYHPPPEVYHRPDIVVHRAPLVIHRSPIVYHQPPVVVHRPAVVYHQPPVMFHQPPPVVHQPMFTSNDVYTPHHSLSLVSSSTSPSYSTSVVIPQKAFQKSSLPDGKMKSHSKKVSKKSRIKKHHNEKEASIPKGSIIHQIQDLFSESDAKKLAHFFSHGSLKSILAAQLLSIIRDRKPDRNSIKPIVHDVKIKALTVEQLGVIEDFLDQNEIDSTKLHHFLKESSALKLPFKTLGKKFYEFIKRSKRSHQREEKGSKKEEILKAIDFSNTAKKNAVLVKRPPIVYHPPPEVYHRPDIVVHRAPLVIHRAPIVYHQPPVVVHRPAVVYHQPPVLFHQPPPVVSQPVLASNDVFHETTTLTHTSSALTPHGSYLGVPAQVLAPTTAFGKSTVPTHKKQDQHKNHSKKSRRAIPKKEETEKASKKNAVLVKRPPIVYHPPPEVYHRPDIVVHRAPIVIHRAPLVYHQPPVIVHRPAVVYHQPAVVFHQPPPVVHQPMFTSHDTFTPHETLVLGESSTTKIGDFEGPPPEMYATRKGDVPKNVKGTSRNAIPKNPKDTPTKKDGKPYLHATKDNEDHPHERSTKDKGEHSHRRSHLRKLILSLQKDDSSRKSDGLVAAAGSPLVLQRPPLILSRPAMVTQGLGHSFVAPMANPVIQRVVQPVPVYQPVVRPVAVPVVRPVPVPVVYHHHHWPVHFHHHHVQPLVVAPHPIPVPHYTTYTYHAPHYSPYFYGKSDVPKSSEHHKKDTIHIHDFGTPAHGHIGHVNGHSHVVYHHGYIARHADCPRHCGTCYPNCPSDCKPHCVAIIHHQHHRPQHVFVDHHHHHHIAQTHFHNHHWPVHHHDVYHGYPNLPYRHIGHPYHVYPPYHHHGRRDTSEDIDQKTTIPHYKVYQHVKHWYPPCIHNSHMCHHHHHPMTVYHDHHHPTKVLHHHHYHPYPVYHHHEHIKPVIYHHIKPYPIHHHHEHFIHDTWHHNHHHHHQLPPEPYPVPVEVPRPVICPYPIPQCQQFPVSIVPSYPHLNVGRSHVPHKESKKSKTAKLGKKSKNKKKDVVVNRPPIIYHPPPEVYHRPEIVVHRAPVLIHRPPIVYHQPSVIVHRPPVVYHQPPVIFHQPSPTVNQPVLYSHDNFVVHPTMLASHAGTMVESAGHFLGVPSGPITNFPGNLPAYGGLQGFGMEPYATPFGRKRRSTKESSSKGKTSHSKKGDKKNSIVVHRPPVIYHPPPEIYHRPRVVVHRPDVLIHRPPIVYHQPPVVLHRPPVVYHQTPIVFHQPPPMVNQPVYHSHDAYAPHPVFTHYDSDVHHIGAYQGVPPYGEEYHGFGGYHGFFGGFHGFHGGFGGYPGLHGGIAFPGGFGGFHGGFANGLGRSKIEKPKKGHDKKKKIHEKSARKKTEKAHRKHSVVVHRPPVIFHPAPEVYHRPAYVIHQPDIVIHRPPVVYHQSPVVAHRPPVVYHQPPVVYHQPPPVIVQPTYHHHQFWHECKHFSHGCYGGPGIFGGGLFGHGFHGNGFHGFGGFGAGYPFLYGKSSVPKLKHAKKRSKAPSGHKVDNKESKNHHTTDKDTKGSKKNDIVIHRPPLVYHPPPEIYHRPDIVVHRPDVLVHRPSIVYDQPAVVVHRPAVIYHEPPVVFHQPPPMINLPVFHESDMYAPQPIFTAAGSHVDYDHNIQSVPPHFSYGQFGVSHAYGKSKIEGDSEKETTEKDSRNKNVGKDSKTDNDDNNSKQDDGKKKYSGESTGTKHSSESKHHSIHHTKKKSETNNAHKKYHLIMNRPPIIYHPAPTIYHRPDVVVHQPDIVIHRPSVVVQPPPVVVHKPAVVYHQPPVVFHQPPPAIHQPMYNSHDAYAAQPVYTHVGSHLERGMEYLGHPGLGPTPYAQEFPAFGKSKIQETEKSSKTEKKHAEEETNTKKTEHDKPKHEKEKHQNAKSKRDTQVANTKRVQLPHAQKEKTETGTKKNAIVVRRPPIIYHPPPEVYHRPDIVVHRAPIVIQRAPLVYHQSPVIVHRPAVVYHQPAVVFHQPAPTVHQPVYHSVDTFNVHPHLSFSQAGSSVHQVGEYVGIPSELMHRSNIEHADPHPKQRRSTLEQQISPVTPINFFYSRQPSFESPRSTIPYPTLNALHPHSLSYASIPWGYAPRNKRSVGDPYSHSQFTTMVPQELFPLPYSPFFHSQQRPHVNINIETAKSSVPKGENRQRRQPILDSSLQTPTADPSPAQSEVALSEAMHYGQLTPFPPRQHVNVNIETVKSHVPLGENRQRRQSVLDPTLQTPPYPMQSEEAQSEAMHYGQLTPFPVLPRPHVNVNVETMKSAVPRSRRQVLAGLPIEETQPSLATAPQTYSQPVVPVAPAQLPLRNPPEEPFGVYRDLLGAIYPRGVRRRPKVNIVVQTAKSNIPTTKNFKKTSVPDSLRKENVDAFSTMPEVTTIEPPLLRDGVRVNMIDLPDPTLSSKPSPSANFAPKLPVYNNVDVPSYGSNILGLGAQGDYGIDKWKKSGIQYPQKSTISEPSFSWHDVNAEKKSSVPEVHRDVVGKKRYMVDGFQYPVSQYQSGLQPQGSIPLAQPASAGYTAPAGYVAEPQGFESQTNGIFEQGQPEPATYGNQISGVPQPGRPHVNVNVETIKKHTLGSGGLPSKRQLIGTLPLISLFRPNPNTAKPSLKSMVPNKNQHKKPANSPPPVTKRQQIIRRVPLAQALPQLRHRVTTARISPARSSRGYAAFPVKDTQTPFQTPRAYSFQGVQPASPLNSQVLPPARTEFYVQPSVTQAPAPMATYLQPTLFPWGGRRQHVNINIQTAKSRIPSKTNKIITPRFKREFPVLYNIIKAKAKLDTRKDDGKTRRNKRQIPVVFPGGFLQSLIPNPNELAKRAFYRSVPRYPINPAVLFPRAERPRPESSEKLPAGTIEVGGNPGGSTLSNAASLLKNEFSQSFDDIAKIQRQEVAAIKGMNMGSQPSSSPVVSLPAQASPGAEVMSVPEQRALPGLMSAPGNVEASAVPLQGQAQQAQPEVVPVSPQQAMASFATAPQVLSASGQPLPARYSPQAPMEIAPGFVRGKPEPAVQATQPAFQTFQPAFQAADPAVSPSKNSFTEEAPLPGQVPGFPPQLMFPGIQFPFLPPAELPSAAPYPRPLLNPIPQPEDDSDRPSVNIQVQTSKSKIPKLKNKKKDSKKNTH